MKEELEFDIRYSTMEDLESLERWFSDEKETEPFPFNGKEKEQALKNWIGFSKFKASLTAIINEVPVGIGTLFLMPYRKVAHHCSFYLIVDPKYRKRGIGASLVKNLAHLAKSRFRLEALHIELLGGSKLASVLKSQGFQEIVRQENFAKINGKSKSRMIWEKVL